MKENSLTPDQTNDNLVTIKAVAADTKTVLNGADVVWEETDEIKVVLDMATDELQDFEASAVDGATATFKGQFAGDVASASQAYAVYPSTAVTMLDNSASIYHTIDDEQYGEIKSGDNLSYASLDVEKLAAGNATATFSNVYSLIKVTVPAGLTEVTIASESPLAGTAPFKMEAGTLKVNTLAWSSLDQEKTVHLLPSEGEHLEAKTHDVLIFPGTHALTITLSDGTTTYEKTVATKEYAAATYYNLNLTTVLSAPVTEYLASPFGGGTIEIPFVTTVAAPIYDVQIENGGGWLSYVDVKALTQGTVTLAVATGENTTADRTATVTVTETTSGKSMVVSVTQKYVELDLLGEYVETYVRGTGQATETGSFEIKRTDNISKGVYLVDGILGGQKVYADYVDGTLTCYDNGNKRNLTVSNNYQISANSGLQIGLISIAPYGGKYLAVKKQGEPELTAEEEALVGMYNEAWVYVADYGAPEEAVSAPYGMTISVSDEAAFGRLKVTFLSKGGSFSCYANLVGSNLNVLSNGANHVAYGTAQHDITMTVSEGTLSFSSLMTVTPTYKYPTIKNYTATKVESAGGAVTAEDLIGTRWSQTLTVRMWGSDVPQSGEMTISATDNDSYGALKVSMFPYGGTNGTYYADLSNDGNKLIIHSENSQHATYGPITTDITLDITSDLITWEGSITLTSGYDSYEWVSFTATKL